MSDTADYWKERYEAVCQMAREDREELKAQIESLQVDVSAKQRMIDSQAARLDERLAEIESLQRTNEELERDAVPRSRYKAVCKEVDEWKQKYGDLTAKATAEIDRLEAAAITPEMREKAEAALAEYVSWQRYSKCVEVVRDLLKETVEPIGRALNWVSVDEEVPVNKAAVMLWYENGTFSRGWYDKSIENFRDDAFTLTDNLAVTHWAIPADPQTVEPTLEGEQ